MKLSIVVPVYNTVKTLERCVGSITSQGLADYELLLVDDGSPDGGGQLAERLAAGDGRIKVFHKPNGGLSDARNYGLDRAMGDYIAFVDSDDELAPGTLVPLMGILKKNSDYDILEFPVTERPGTDTEHIFNPGVNEYADAAEWLSEQGLTHCWAWNKVYKRWVFDGVRFPVGRRFEDVLTMGKIIKKRPFIATTDKGMYMYNWNEGGIVAQSVKGGSPELLRAQVEMVADLGIDTRQSRWHRLYIDMFTNQLHAYKDTGKILLRGQHVSVMKYGRHFGVMKIFMLNVLGLRLSCKLFKLLYR